MAQQLAENLYCLEIPLVGSSLKTLNSYLITGERNLLIDTGFRQDWKSTRLNSSPIQKSRLPPFA